MSFESVRAWLADRAPDLRLIEAHASTATVADAAETLGVAPGQIAKTLTVRAGGETFLLVARGDARLDNQKSKAAFGGRPRMLGPDEVLALTSHAVGGVCPFGLPGPIPIYLDMSINVYDEMIPAGGDTHASVRLSVKRLTELCGSKWVDACQPPQTDAI
jgi:prolyl-tRNA editing enzyme YbaK/EbsC (Cys-tRNA(Pro) deacylase)